MCLSGRSNSLITFEKLFGKESTDYDGNPSKGWYGLYPFVISEEPDFDNLVWSLADGDVIALVRIDIGRRQPGVGQAHRSRMRSLTVQTVFLRGLRSTAVK